MAHSGSTSLANGWINTRTNVDDRAAIGYDLEDIYNGLFKDEEDGGPDHDAARSVYINGANSYKIDSTGQPTSKTRTIQGFSTAAASTGKFDGQSTYNFFLYGLANKDVTQMSKYQTFADDFVLALLDDDSSGSLPYEAMVALNIYTYCTYELWDMIQDCEDEQNGVLTNALTNNLGRGILALDEFIAFYVGSNQESGTQNGYSLYAMSQITGENFGTTDPISKVNANIKELYEEGLQYLSFANACQSGSDTLELLHGVVNRIISQMNVILMQMLLSAVYNNDIERIAIYGLSLIPQLSKCKSSTYTYLKQTLLDNRYDEDDYIGVLGALQSCYECLGFNCEDVGVYLNGYIGQCSDKPPKLPMAGYTPDTDTHSHALIDLDILEIKGLADMSLWNSAEYLYKYGKHSYKGDGTLRTLQGLATSDNRQKAIPYYSIFTQYWVDVEYANTFIMDALNANGKFASASSTQRKEIIVKTIQYQVLFMYAMYEFRDSVQDCQLGDALNNIDSVSAFDEGAAFLIGSLEGTEYGGANDLNDGLLHYNLAQKRSIQFGTMDDSTKVSKVNEELMELLWAGKAALNNLDCEEVSTVVDKIQQITLIPLLQGVLRYALKNEGHSAPFDETSKDLGEGEAFTKSILPLVCEESNEACTTLTVNMIMEEGVKPVVDGPQVVANALQTLCNSETYSHITCDDVGTVENIDMGSGGMNAVSKRSSSSGNKQYGSSLYFVTVVINTILSLFVLSVL